MSAIDFASAFGTYLETGPVVIGRDTRRTGERLHSAVIAGLLSTGVDVYDVGTLPAPVIQHAVTHMGARGGVAISGPSAGPEWKALRFFGADGAALNSYQDEELLDIFHNGTFAAKPWNQLGRLSVHDTAIRDYSAALQAFLDGAAIRARHFKVVLDCGNGTAAQCVAQLLTDLGCDVIAINNTPSPDAVYTTIIDAHNTQSACQLVKPVGADVGFYFNLDATNVVVISEQGQSLGEEATFALLTDYILSRQPGQPVVTNVSTTSLIDDIAAKYGATVSRCRIGQKYIIERMRSMTAALGGEGSGGAAFPNFLYGIDGIASLGMVLQMLAQRQVSVSELMHGFPAYTIKKDAVRCPVFLFHTILRRIAELFAGETLDLTDGVKISFASGWLHIRPSRNEPIMRIIAESHNPADAENLLQRGKTEVRKAMI